MDKEAPVASSAKKAKTDKKKARKYLRFSTPANAIRKMGLNAFATLKLRDDIEKIIFPSMTDRCSEQIRKIYGNLNYFSLGKNATEQQKNEFKERSKRYSKFKNTVVGGLMNWIVKHYFANDIVDPTMQREFLQHATKTDGKAAKSTKAKFRKQIERWWLLAKDSVLAEIIDNNCKNPTSAMSILNEIQRYAGEDGWKNINLPNKYNQLTASAQDIGIPASTSLIPSSNV